MASPPWGFRGRVNISEDEDVAGPSHRPTPAVVSTAPPPFLFDVFSAAVPLLPPVLTASLSAVNTTCLSIVERQRMPTSVTSILSTPLGSLHAGSPPANMPLAWSSGCTLVATPFPSFLGVWRAVDGRLLHALTDGGDATDVCFSPDGERLFATVAAACVAWNVRTGGRVARLTFVGGPPVQKTPVCLLMTRDETRVFVSVPNENNANELVGHVYDETEALQFNVWRGPNRSAMMPVGGEFSMDGNLLMLVTRGLAASAVEVWTTMTRSRQPVLPVRSKTPVFYCAFACPLRLCAFSPVGDRLFALCENGDFFMMISLTTARASPTHALDVAEVGRLSVNLRRKCEFVLTGGIRAACWSRLGDLLYCVTCDGVQVRRSVDGVLLRAISVFGEIKQLLGEALLACAAALSPDGHSLAVRGSRRVALLNVNVNVSVFADAGRGRTIDVMCRASRGDLWSPDGRLFALFSSEVVAVFSFPDVKKLWEAAGLVGVSVARFSSDGRRLLAACRDGVRTWDVASGTPVPTAGYEGGGGTEGGAFYSPPWAPGAISPDGLAVFVIHEKAPAPAFFVRRSATVPTFDNVGEVRGPLGARLYSVFDEPCQDVRDASFSKTGKALVAIFDVDGGRNALRAWDVSAAHPDRPATCVFAVRCVEGFGSCMFSPGNAAVISAVTHGGVLHVFDVSTTDRFAALDEDDLASKSVGVGDHLSGGCWSPKGTFLCCIRWREVQVRHAKTGALCRTVALSPEQHDDYLEPVSVSPDGRTLLCTGMKNAHLFCLR